MDVFREIIARFSLDISMYFGMDKCAVIHTEKEKIPGHSLFTIFLNYQVKSVIITSDYCRVVTSYTFLKTRVHGQFYQ